MHGEAMIHGDLKGVWFRTLVVALSPNALHIVIKANILIDQGRHARLADFGLLTIISDPTNFTASSSYVKGGTTRWMSPELLYPDLFGFKDSRPTKESDCYALGMVVLEVLSGQRPFASDQDFTVMRKVMGGERPGRPEGPEGVWFTSSLWGMLEQCWAIPPESRPSIDTVLQSLERVSGTWEPPPQQAGWDVGSDEDDPNHAVVSGYFFCVVSCGSTIRSAFVLTTSLALSGFTLSGPQPSVTYPLGRPTKRRYCTGSFADDTTILPMRIFG